MEQAPVCGDTMRVGGQSRRFWTGLLVACVLALLGLAPAEAGTVTSATGGGAISATTAVNGGTGAWTTLTGPTYAETVNGDLNNGTVVLTAPAGFQFNTAAALSVVLVTGDSNASKNMNNAAVGGVVASTANGTLTVTSSTITFTVLSKSQGNTLNTIRWTGLQVRPLDGYPLVSGNLTASGSSGISLVASSTNFGTLATSGATVEQLLVVLPGQTFTAGSGISGTPTAQVAGTPFSISRIVATDRFFNVVSGYAGTKTLAYSGPGSCGIAPAYTTSVTFTAGVAATVPLTLRQAQTTTLTAADNSIGVAGPASSAFVVSPGAMTGLVVTLPGQTFVACTGNTGTPASQQAGVSFAITSLTAVDQYNNIVTSYSGGRTIGYSGPSGAPSYTTAVSFTSGQSTTTLTTTLTVAETTAIKATDAAAGVAGPSSSSFVVTAPSGPTGFNAFEILAAAGTTTGGVLKTKVAGNAFAFDIVALTAGPAVLTSFTGTVKVELVDAASSTNCSSMSSIQTLVDQTFAASDSGRHRVSAVTENRVWPNVRVRISYPVSAPTTVSCSADPFAIRPNAFTVAATDLDRNTAGTARVLSNAGVAGTVHTVGQPFTLTVTALTGTGTAAVNYSASPSFTVSQCATASFCPSPGTLSLGSWTALNGVLTSTTASYNDLGSFLLTVQDATFAAIDVADSSVAERVVSSPSQVVGRFVPSHLRITSAGLTPRADLPGCSASPFTYMSEPFRVSLTVSAVDGSGAVLTKYAGALAPLTPSVASLGLLALDAGAPTTLFGRSITAITQAMPAVVTTSTAHGLATGDTVFISGVSGMTEVNDRTYTVTVISSTRFRLDTSSATWAAYGGGGTVSRLALDASGSISGSFASGTATFVVPLRFLRRASPDGPWDNGVVVAAPADSDGVTIRAADLTAIGATADFDTDSDGVLDHRRVGGTQWRFGVLRLNNAYGDERLALPIPITLQYWNGTTLATHAADSCTSLSASSISFSAYTGGLAAASMGAGNVVLGGFTAGVGSLKLTRPLPQPTSKGGVTVTINLTAENKDYLKGRWSTTTWNASPSANAAFGIYRTNGIIYYREVY